MTVAEVGVLEPQSNVLFLLLMVMFAALAGGWCAPGGWLCAFWPGAWPSCPR